MIKKSLVLIGVSVLLGGSMVANAGPFPSTPGLFLQDDTTGLTDFVPFNPAGTSFSGSIGSWTLTVDVGSTLSGGSNPSLDLQVYAKPGSTATGNLELWYSDVGFGPSAGTYVLNTTVVSTPGLSVSAGLDTGNAAFGNWSSLGGYSGAGTVQGPVTAGAPYSLTIYNSIAPGGTTASLDTSLSVPDSGTTLSLLGLGLLAVEGLRRRLML